MECPYCLSDEHVITPDFEFECKYCLSKIEQTEITEFIQQFSDAYITKDNLSALINQYFQYIKEFRFPFIIRDYVQSNYNYNVIADEIRKLPIHESQMIRKITSSDTRVGFDFVRSSEVLNQIIVNQHNIPDLSTRLELLAITIANEEGSFPYLSFVELDYLYLDPNANAVIESLIKSVKQLDLSTQKIAKPIIDNAKKRLRLQSKYFEELSPPAKFEVKKVDTGVSIVNCSDKSKIIRIPPIIHGEIVVSIESKAFVSNKAETIEIPFTIKLINSSSFIDLKNLRVIKLGNQTPIHPSHYLNCSRLEIIEIVSSHSYTNIDGIIFSEDKRELLFFPPGLQKSMLELSNSIRVKQYSCYSANLLRDIKTDSSAIVIEDQAFRLDEHSRLTLESKGIISTLLQAPNNNKKNKIRELLESNDNTNAKLVVGYLDDRDSESLLLRAQVEEDNGIKLDLLTKAYSLAENYIDQALVLDEMIKLNEGQEKIISLNLEEPYLLYYLGMTHSKRKTLPMERILQLFLDSYNAGNHKAGVNASTLMKSASNGVYDLGLAERILIDLTNKEDIQAKFKLVQFYNEFPHLCNMDLTSIIQELNDKLPEEFNPLYADLLYKGNLIEADKDEAIKLMQMLSEDGDKNMSYQLGYIYYSDESKKSIEDAISYLNRAHRQGHPDAKRTILKIQQ